jgi:hypothetical protein
MPFNQKEFEHKIDEVKLKKGLKTFLKNRLELINKIGNESFTFLIHEKNSGEIFIQFKAEQILNYNCFCGDVNYCEHLAAALFYLQQETLSILKVKSLRKKAVTTKIKQTKKNSFIKQIETIKEIIKPYAIASKLTSTAVNEIYKKVHFEKSGAATFGQDFYFDLAIVCELPKLPNYKYADSENVIDALVENAKQEIENYFNKGFSVNETEAFIDATYYSLRSQQNFRPGMYGFFISIASVMITNKNTTADLKILLKKRKQNKNKIGSINRKNVSELQLSMRDAELANKPFSLKNYESTLEVPIALAEMEFHKHNDAKAFKLLELYAEKIKIENINKYLDLIIEVLVYTKKYHSKKYEQKYLLEKFVFGYFIDEKELDRFFELNKAHSKEFVALELIEKIKSESLFFTFEKIAIILLSQNKFDELVDEIKKEKNKFKLLNEIGIKKLPHYELDFLALYTKHFLTAVAEAKFPYFQQQLFDIAKTYLDLLPLEIKGNMIETFKDKLLYERHMVEYISKLYPLIV